MALLSISTFLETAVYSHCFYFPTFHSLLNLLINMWLPLPRFTKIAHSKLGHQLLPNFQSQHPLCIFTGPLVYETVLTTFYLETPSSLASYTTFSWCLPTPTLQCSVSCWLLSSGTPSIWMESFLLDHLLTLSSPLSLNLLIYSHGFNSHPWGNDTTLYLWLRLLLSSNFGILEIST